MATRSLAGSRLDGAPPAAAAATVSPALRLAYLRARQAEATPGYAFRAAGPQGFESLSEAQGLRVRLNAAGEVEVRPAAEAGGFRVGLHLSGYGAGAGLSVDGEAATVRASGNRVEVTRKAGPARDVREWYVNGPAGLEQGFSVARPPLGKAGDGLLLAVALSGDLVPRLSPDGEAVDLYLGRSPVLSYGGLHVEDATGKVLPAWLSLRPGSVVELRVEDRGAAYPVTVDPWLQLPNLVPTSALAANTHFGIAVAVSGNTALVGARDYFSGGSSGGGVFVFVRSGGGWAQQAVLMATGSAFGDRFGSSVALYGDTALIGAPARNGSRGSAFVFARTGAAWSQVQELTAADAAPDARFGTSVALNGTMFVVGANNRAAGAGGAYVFRAPGFAQQQLTAGDAAAVDWCGISVATTGNLVAMGCLWKPKPGHPNNGAVYVFEDAAGTFSQIQKLDPDSSYFGQAVALSVKPVGPETTLLVGASNEDISLGAAYVYTFGGGAFTLQQRLVPAVRVANDYFGTAVALNGDFAAVGPSGVFSSIVSVFTRSGATWGAPEQVTVLGVVNGDRFGAALAVDGFAMVVGAEGTASFTGAAYGFQSNLPNGAACTPTGTPCQSGFCVDSVCCDLACNNLSAGCQACSLAAGASADGTCTTLTGHSCSDGNACTSGDVCSGTGSCGGTAYSCTPTQCQQSSTCDGAGGCTIVNKLNTATCDDGNACTSNDHCDGLGGCGGSAYTCTPTQCQQSSTCDGAGGCTIVNKPNTAVCNDGIACSSNDRCDGSGGCAGVPYACVANQCRILPGCDGNGGCTYAYLASGTACDDGSLCTSGDVCDGAGTCGGTSYSCTPKVCEATSGCDGKGGCAATFKAGGAGCDDGDACTTGDACDGGGQCKGALHSCTPGPCEASSSCDGTGGCTVVTKPDGTPCNQGSCLGGQCVASTVDAGPAVDGKVKKEAGVEAGTKKDAGVKKEAGATKEAGAPKDAAVPKEAGANEAGGKSEAGFATEAGRSPEAAPPREASTTPGPNTGNTSGCSCTLSSAPASDSLGVMLLLGLALLGAGARTVSRRYLEGGPGCSP